MLTFSIYQFSFNHYTFSQQEDLGVFIPECNPENGAFLAEQCNATLGVCWCVDKNGHEKPNTRALVERGTRNCSQVGNKPSIARSKLPTEAQSAVANVSTRNLTSMFHCLTSLERFDR